MDNLSKIASCNICLLAERMKSCATCPLNPFHLKLTDHERNAVEHKELLQPKGLKVS